MKTGVTCYERDEMLCEDQHCYYWGCKMRERSRQVRHTVIRIVDPPKPHRKSLIELCAIGIRDGRMPRRGE